MKEKDDSFLMVEHKVWDAWMKIKIRPHGEMLLKCIYRKTAGWNKVWDGISRAQFIEATGIISRQRIQTELNILEFQNLITRKFSGRTGRIKYRIQIDRSKWRSFDAEAWRNHLTRASGQVTREKHLTRTSGQTVEFKALDQGVGSKRLTKASSQTFDQGVGSKHPQKKLSKETISKDMENESPENLIKRKTKEIQILKEQSGLLKLTEKQKKDLAQRIKALNAEISELQKMSGKTDTVEMPADEIWEDAEIEKEKEKPKAAGLQPHERTEKLKEL